MRDSMTKEAVASLSMAWLCSTLVYQTRLLFDCSIDRGEDSLASERIAHSWRRIYAIMLSWEKIMEIRVGRRYIRRWGSNSCKRGIKRVVARNRA